MKYNFESLYEHIGYLFYGLVCKNGKISAADLLKLTDHIDSNWKPGTSGDQTLSFHLADCIHRGVRFASTNMMTSAHAFESFKGYYLVHALGFGDTMRERIGVSVKSIMKEIPVNADAPVIEAELARMFAKQTIAS